MSLDILMATGKTAWTAANYAAHASPEVMGHLRKAGESLAVPAYETASVNEARAQTTPSQGAGISPMISK